MGLKNKLGFSGDYIDNFVGEGLCALPYKIDVKIQTGGHGDPPLRYNYMVLHLTDKL